MNTNIEKEVKAICGTIGSRALAAAASDVVSPAVSQAISASTGENYKTEPDANKSCSQSGGNSLPKPNCYECKYRRPVPGDAHSQCVHPILDAVPGGQFIPMFFALKGLRSPIEKRLNLTYSEHGFRCGWFMWPMNFDPAWLESCEGFETTGTDERASG